MDKCQQQKDMPLSIKFCPQQASSKPVLFPKPGKVARERSMLVRSASKKQRRPKEAAADASDDHVHTRVKLRHSIGPTSKHHSGQSALHSEAPASLPHQMLLTGQQKKVGQSGTSTDSKIPTLTLAELNDQYSHLFPLTVCACEGICKSGDEADAISSGEMFNIHFLKETKSVRATDSFSEQYNITINSTAKFGVIYTGCASGAKPAVFEMAGHISSTFEPPCIIAATQSYNTHSRKTSVERGEILIIKGIQRSLLGLGRQALKVFSVTKQENKVLQKDCAGRFSTDPHLTQLHLSELLCYLKKPFPLETRIFFDPNIEQDLPRHLASCRVTLLSEKVEKSLIATPLLPDEGEESTRVTSMLRGGLHPVQKLLELALDLEIRVRVVESTQSESDKLCSFSKELYDTLSISTVTPFKVSKRKLQSRTLPMPPTLESQLDIATLERQLDIDTTTVAEYEPKSKNFYQTLSPKTQSGRGCKQPLYQSLLVSHSQMAQQHCQAHKCGAASPQDTSENTKTTSRLFKADSLPNMLDIDTDPKQAALNGMLSELQHKIKLLQLAQHQVEDELTKFPLEQVQRDISNLRRKLDEVASSLDKLTLTCTSVLSDFDSMKEDMSQICSSNSKAKVISRDTTDKQLLVESNRRELANLQLAEVSMMSRLHVVNKSGIPNSMPLRKWYNFMYSGNWIHIVHTALQFTLRNLMYLATIIIIVMHTFIIIIIHVRHIYNRCWFTSVKLTPVICYLTCTHGNEASQVGHTLL